MSRRDNTHTSSDLPLSIPTAAGTTQLSYDASSARVKKQGPGGMTLSLPDL